MSIRPDVSKWARQVGSFDGFPQAIREHIVAVEAERDELQQLLDLQHSRTVKADKLWRGAR
jgi:hypothetical protein